MNITVKLTPEIVLDWLKCAEGLNNIESCTGPLPLEINGQKIDNALMLEVDLIDEYAKIKENGSLFSEINKDTPGCKYAHNYDLRTSYELSADDTNLFLTAIFAYRMGQQSVKPQTNE